jgi:hypothetical protein
MEKLLLKIGGGEEGESRGEGREDERSLRF